MQPLSDNALDDIVARERSLGAPPLTDWDSLADRLRAEGLIRESTFSRFSSSPMLRIAAALVLVAGGAAGGRASAGAPVLPVQPASSPVVAMDATQGNPASPSTSLTSDGPINFSSPEQAWEVLNRAGEEYQQASEYLSANNNEIPMPPSTDQYRTRLAALDNVMSEMRVALKQAPQDPVINQYYLATVGAREATLRQLGTVLPASASMNRF
ncbi:MAG: hypothetical protein ACSLFK_00325 [Gemmatimonadaceae bacterium]